MYAWVIHELGRFSLRLCDMRLSPINPLTFPQAFVLAVNIIVTKTIRYSVSSSIYRTGPLQGVKSPIEACALGGGSVCSLKTVNIKKIKMFKL